MSFLEQEKKFAELLIGKKVQYLSGYDDGKLFEYEIIEAYPNAFGRIIWVDLKAVSPDIHTHYSKHWSVTIACLGKDNKELLDELEKLILV